MSAMSQGRWNWKVFWEAAVGHNKWDKNHIYKHCNENSHLHPWLNNLKIIGRSYGNRLKRKISGDLLINGLKPLSNEQDKSFPLK